MSESTRQVEVLRAGKNGAERGGDVLAVEEPLEIRIGATPVCVTLRTPGHDGELAAGFLLTENVVGSVEDLSAITRPESRQQNSTGNVICVTLRGDARTDLARLRRNFYATSSCGICGKASLEQVRQFAKQYSGQVSLSRDVVCSLPQRMRAAQTVFDRTGGLHAAALFHERGEMLCLREDVGRHNAVDKVIGWALLQGRLPLDRVILQVSGRASFEITQKALVAGLGVVCAVSAVSSLAVDLADANNMTLIGFVRDGGLVAYTGAQRIRS